MIAPFVLPAIGAAGSLLGGLFGRRDRKDQNAAAAAAMFGGGGLDLGALGGTQIGANAQTLTNLGALQDFTSLFDVSGVKNLSRSLQAFGGNPLASSALNFSSLADVPGVSQDDMLNVFRGTQAGQGLGGAFANSALQQLLTGGQSADALASSRLGILREQARPQEERLLNQFRQNLFSRGQTGSTGGGILTEAFARGLGQADLSRQVAAQDFGLGVQRQAGELASLFGGQSQAQFGAASGLQDSLFGRLLDASTARNARRQETFGRQLQLTELSDLLQNSALGRAVQSQQGLLSSGQFGLDQIRTALAVALGRSGANAAAAGQRGTREAEAGALGGIINAIGGLFD